jgi:hypothetical protein
MASKRSLETDDAETHNSPQYTTERPKTSTFNALAIGKMGYNFELPETMTVLRNKMHEPWKLGFAVGVMLYHISPLLSTHLTNAVGFQNPVPRALTSLPDFVSAIDQCIDKALSGTQWVVYPINNVVAEAGEGDWAVWLRGRCEELGMAEAKAGRRVLEDM